MDRTWKPFWLRPVVLITFGSICFLCIALLQTLQALSNRNQGLGNGNQNYHYIWTYLPTTWITILLASWFRVTFQAQITAPWLRLLSGLPSKGEHSLTLDYTSMLQPTVLVKSFRLRDWLVTASIVGCMILQLTVLFSTGLLTVEWTKVTLDPVPIILETEFKSGSSSLQPTNDIDLWTVYGVLRGNISYPIGTTDEFAYQSIQPDSLAHGTTDRLSYQHPETIAIVDGFMPEIRCEHASMSLRSFNDIKDYDPSGQNSSLDGQGLLGVTLESPSYFLESSFGYFFTDGNNDSSDRVVQGQHSGNFAGLLLGRCDPSDGLDSYRIAFTTATINYTWGLNSTWIDFHDMDPNSVEIDKSAQVICDFSYRSPRLQLIQNGTKPPIISLANTSYPSGHDFKLHPCEIVVAVVESLSSTLYRGPIGGIEVQGDRFMRNFFKAYQPTSIDSLYNEDYLIDSMSQYLRMFSIQIIGSSMTQAAAVTSTGSAAIYAYRVLVNPFSCHVITALLFLLGIICFFMASSKQRHYCPYNINRILALGMTFSRSNTLKDLLTPLGPVSDKELRRAIGTCEFLTSRTGLIGTTNPPIIIQCRSMEHPKGITNLRPQYGVLNHTSPIVLRSITTIFITTVLVILILLLEISLQYSQMHYGLTDIASHPYLRYVVTFALASSLGLLNLYFRSVDFEVRTLAPYQLMKSHAQSYISIRLDLLNGILPRVMHNEIRSRSYSSLVATFVTILASLFTIFSASIFHEDIIYKKSPARLRTIGSFDNQRMLGLYDASETDGLSSSLILLRNSSYPRLTYEDLTFIETVLEDADINTTNPSFQKAGLEMIHATIPALRPKSTCEFLPFTIDEYPDFTNKSVVGNWRPDIFIQIIMNYTSGRETSLNLNFPLLDTTNNIFAIDFDQFTYAWGRLDFHANATPTMAASLIRCEETIEAVDVRVAFSGADLFLHPSYPPQPVDSSARISSLDLGFNSVELISNSFNRLFTPFFQGLTTSRYAIPISDLGDPSKADKVASAISFQYGIIRAQTLNAHLRSPINESSVSNATLPNSFARANQTNDDIIYPAELEISEHRLLQSPMPTRILEALIGAVLLLYVLNRVFGPPTDILPRSPRSIASGLALIAGGNLFEFLKAYSDEHGSFDEVSLMQEISKDYVVWLGRKECGEPDTKDNASRYGIWILTPKEASEAIETEKRAGSARKASRSCQQSGEF